MPLLLTALLAGCSDGKDYAKGLEQPPTNGPTAGPGSGAQLAAHLQYTMQKNNPTRKVEDASCPDAPDARPGTEVRCTLRVDGDEPSVFVLRMDNTGIWQMSSG